MDNKYATETADRNVLVDRHEAYKRLIAQQEKVLSERLDKSIPHPYKVGDFVLTKVMFFGQGTNKKTRPKYSGPYLVVGINGASLKILSKDARYVKNINCDLTKPCVGTLNRALLGLVERFKANAIDIQEIESRAQRSQQ